MIQRWLDTELDSIWVPLSGKLASLPTRYDQQEAYRQYRAGRAASFDLLIAISPRVLALLTSEQQRRLGPIANYLDVRYLRSLRASTAGAGAIQPGIL
jgi:hypothetical protein